MSAEEMQAAGEPDLSPDLATQSLTQDSIRAELAAVLVSAEFRLSRRCQEFLGYVVDKTLAGYADTLKERTIAMEVFGKALSYDSSEDAAVRVKAGDVRRRLGLYYTARPDHRGVIIDLPVGTYVPEFRMVKMPTPVIPSAPELSATADSVVRGILLHARGLSSAKRWWALLAVCLLAAGAIGVAAFYWQPAPSVLDEFWLPVLQTKTPVSVCVSTIPVYSLRTEPIPSGPIPQTDLIAVPDQFVAAGDVRATRAIEEMLERMKRPYHLRIGNELRFQDLRSGPAVLVGFSYSEWEEINSGFRFFLDTDRQPNAILDNGQVKWAIAKHPDDHDLQEDYAVVSRVFDPATHSFLIEVSGLAHYGTEAAADLVTNPALLSEALKGAPQGWQKKNLQFVLRVQVINNAPGIPEVIATHFW